MKGIVVYHQAFQVASVPTCTDSVGDCLGYSTDKTLKWPKVLLGANETSTGFTLCHLQWIGLMSPRFKLKTPLGKTIKQLPLITLIFNNEKS